jgi:hypothetical protein
MVFENESFFLPRWCNWINQIVKGDIENFFQTMHVIKQGDPLSPILFNLVVDIQATLIFLAKPNGKFRVVPHLVCR